MLQGLSNRLQVIARGPGIDDTGRRQQKTTARALLHRRPHHVAHLQRVEQMQALIVQTTRERRVGQRPRLADAGAAAVVVPVDEFDRIIGQLREHQLTAAQVQHVDARPLLPGVLQDLEVVTAAKFAILLLAREQLEVGQLRGEEEAIHPGLQTGADEVARHPGDGGQGGVQRLGLLLQVVLDQGRRSLVTE